jgi:hypothetical protein
VANNAQQLVSRLLGNGEGGRTDYSSYSVGRPKTQEQLDRLRYEAHSEGPGSESWDVYHAVLQQGLDQDLPSATGGVPRSVADTAALIHSHQQRSAKQFLSVPALLNNVGWNGVSFAQLGPEATATIVAENVASCLPHERAQWYAVQKALEAAEVSSMGIEYQVDDSPVLEYTTPSDTQEDPSGYSQYLSSKGMTQEGLNGLMLKVQDHQLYDGLSNFAAGGGHYDHFEAMQLAQLRTGSAQQDPSDCNQGDNVNAFTAEE